MSFQGNILAVGSTGSGKTQGAARMIAGTPAEAAVVLDPHERSLARTVLQHLDGNLLFERLSDLRPCLRYGFLKRCRHADALQGQLEDHRATEAFTEILLRRRDGDGLANAPLLEEWTTASIRLLLAQNPEKPVAWLPRAFMPETPEHQALLRDCCDAELRSKFAALARLTPRALRAEVGSTTRLLGGVFGSPAFGARSGTGFNLGAFLQRRGKLIIERGELGEDASRAIMGAIVLQVIAFAKSRRGALPIIRVYIDEATNARLFGSPEQRALAETRKNGLFFHIMVQNLDFPGGADAVLQNCVRHEWYRCSSHDLARKAATDVIAGLPAAADSSRAERLNQFTQEIMNMPPGVRWVRDQRGSRKERVTMLEDAWPDWPGLRAKKLAEKLAAIRARPEYGGPDEPPSSSSSPATPPRPTSSPSGSSAAARWQQAGGKPVAGSKSSADEAESGSWEPS